MNKEYIYKAKVVNVVDGDTMDLKIDLGFKMTTIQRFRVLNLDTYETRLGRDCTEATKTIGLEAKHEAICRLLMKTVMITTHKDKQGKFGRYLCSIEMPDGVDYAEYMKANGFHKNQSGDDDEICKS